MEAEMRTTSGRRAWWRVVGLAALAGLACGDAAPERGSPGGSSSAMEAGPSPTSEASSTLPALDDSASAPQLSPLLTELGVGAQQAFTTFGDQGPAPYYIIDGEVHGACRFTENLRSVRCVTFPHADDIKWHRPPFGIPLSDAVPWLVMRNTHPVELIEVTPTGPRSIAELGMGGTAYVHEGALFARQGNDLLRWDNMAGAGPARREYLGNDVYVVSFLAGAILTIRSHEHGRSHTTTLARLRASGRALKGESQLIGYPALIGPVVDCGSHGATVFEHDGTSRVMFVSPSDFKIHDLGIRLKVLGGRGWFNAYPITCSADGVVISHVGSDDRGWLLDEVRCDLASCTRETIDLARTGLRGVESVALGDKTLLVGFKGDWTVAPWIPYYRLAKFADLLRTPSQPLFGDGPRPPMLRDARLHATKAGALVLMFTGEPEFRWSPGTIYVVRITPEGKVEKVERMP
jgi:hypothetical protein